MQKHSRLFSTVTLAIAFVAGVAAVRAWREYQAISHRNDVLAGCDSDHLSPLAASLARYAEAHSGHFPAASEALSLATQESHRTCEGSRASYVVNPRLSEFVLHNHATHLLVWCPVGAHPDFAGVVVMRGGKVQSSTITRQELAALLEAELR